MDSDIWMDNRQLKEIQMAKSFPEDCFLSQFPWQSLTVDDVIIPHSPRPHRHISFLGIYNGTQLAVMQHHRWYGGHVKIVCNIAFSLVPDQHGNPASVFVASDSTQHTLECLQKEQKLWAQRKLVIDPRKKF